MAYRTIVVHVDAARCAEQRIRVAAQLAKACDAHLVGAAMSGVSRFLYQDYATAVGASAVGQFIEVARGDAMTALRRFDTVCASEGVNSCETRLVDDEADGGLVLQARYADLLVVSQFDAEEANHREAMALPEYAAMNGVRPVLVVPHSGTYRLPARHALVAWDGSMEATRAITAALPLLKLAGRVTLSLFNASRLPDAHGQEPGADMALFLARHDIKVDVLRQTTEMEVGTALLSQAADLGADLLVMGCYGHGRFREIMLGGATRTVLESMTLPVLLAH